jgi:hypothetical protein
MNMWSFIFFYVGFTPLKPVYSKPPRPCVRCGTKKNRPEMLLRSTCIRCSSDRPLSNLSSSLHRTNPSTTLAIDPVTFPISLRYPYGLRTKTRRRLHNENLEFHICQRDWVVPSVEPPSWLVGGADLKTSPRLAATSNGEKASREKSRLAELFLAGKPGIQPGNCL